MSKKDVEVICDVTPGGIRGEKDGYSYEYFESTEKARAAYAVTNPDGDTKLVNLSHDGIEELVSGPREFWDKYLG